MLRPPRRRGSVRPQAGWSEGETSPFIYFQGDKLLMKMKLLILIDMQNDFIDGALGTKEAVAI